MGLFIQQDERSDLQKKLAAELQERAKEKAKQTDLPDGVEDSEYIKGTKTTTSLAWVWILIIFAVIGIMVWLMAKSMAR